MILANKEKIAEDAMKQAMAWLDRQGISYQYHPPYQLKVGAVNFWPGTGTITIDGELAKRPIKGLAGLESILNCSNVSVAKADRILLGLQS